VAAEGEGVIVTFYSWENKKYSVPDELRKRIGDLEGSARQSSDDGKQRTG